MPNFKYLVTYLLPFACAWVQRQETAILQKGVALTPSQLKDAQQLGIIYPEKIRLLVSETIPAPKHPIWAIGVYLYQIVFSRPIGFALGYGIYIQFKYRNSRSVLIHELVHVAQYERFGSFKAFIQEYLTQILEVGYRNAPLEQEAKGIEQAFCVANFSNRSRR